MQTGKIKGKAYLWQNVYHIENTAKSAWTYEKYYVQYKTYWLNNGNTTKNENEDPVQNKTTYHQENNQFHHTIFFA